LNGENHLMVKVRGRGEDPLYFLNK